MAQVIACQFTAVLMGLHLSTISNPVTRLVPETTQILQPLLVLCSGLNVINGCVANGVAYVTLH